MLNNIIVRIEDEVQGEDTVSCEVVDARSLETHVNYDNLDDGPENALGPNELLRQKPVLTEQHLQDLRKSGLSDEMIEAAGFRSVTEEQAIKFGLAPRSGMLIPYPGIADYFRIRTDSGDPKYLSPANSKNRLYVPPGVEKILQDKSVPLIITEGEKKALKATQEGFQTIGLSGCWNWKTAGEGVLPELEQIKWKDRRVNIIFDSDVISKSEVQAALRALVVELEARKASVRIVLLLGTSPDDKVGLDDFLVRHGVKGKGKMRKLIDSATNFLDSTLELIQPDLEAHILQERLNDVYRAARMYPILIPPFARKIKIRQQKLYRHAPTAKEIESAIKKVAAFVSQRTGDEKAQDDPSAFKDRYEAIDDQTGEVNQTKWGFFRVAGKSREKIANFTVRTTKDVEVIDELDPGRRFELRIAGPTGISSAVVTSNQYAENKALHAALVGAGGIELDPRCKSMDELRSAIASTMDPVGAGNTPAAISKVTTNFGWHESEMFLAPGAYIDSGGFHARTGNNAVPDVDLTATQNARHLKLHTLSNERLLEVQQFIGNRLIELQPHVITYSCLAMIPLAMLYDHLTGYNRFALWLLGRTGTGKSFLGKLIQSFFGDFIKNVGGITTWASTANFIQSEGFYFKNAVYLVDDYKPSVVRPAEVTRILQNYADNTGRGRLQKDATANKTRAIRGMMLSTGEDLPENNAAAIARTIVLRVPKGTPDMELGQDCLRHAKDFPGVTADLVAYLINQAWPTQFQELVDKYQREFYAGIQGRDNAPRIAGNIAMLASGFQIFAEYMSDVWTDPQKQIDEFNQELSSIQDEMLMEAGEQSASQVFLRCVHSMLDSGEALISEGSYIAEKKRPVIGYKQKNGDVALVLPTAKRLVEEHLRATGGSLGCTEGGLLNQLEADGHLVERSKQIRGEDGKKLPRMPILKGQAIFEKEEPPEPVDPELGRLKCEEADKRSAENSRILSEARRKRALQHTEAISATDAVSLVSAA